METSMEILNTTQIPNRLLDREMERMKDTELRVVLIVAKKQGWIPRAEIIKISGKGKDAVRQAITSCVEKQWIQARDENGNLLTTPKQRQGLGRGSKIYYRLGEAFND